MTQDPREHREVELDGLCSRHREIDSLLEQAGHGDREAFAALYDELSPTVHAMSVGRGHPPRFSAHVVQDVFERLLRQAATFDPARRSALTSVRALTVEVMSERSP